MDEGADVCKKCGTPLNDEQEFCPKCGTRKVNVCLKCGAQLDDGQAFCTKCGKKAGPPVGELVAGKTESFIANIARIGQFIANAIQEKKKVLVPIIVVVALAVAALAMVSTIKSPVEKLTAVGNYEEAYSIATDDEKDIIMQENIVAAVCAQHLSFFELRAAYVYGYGMWDIVIVTEGQYRVTDGNGKILHDDDKPSTVYVSYDVYSDERRSRIIRDSPLLAEYLSSPIIMNDLFFSLEEALDAFDAEHAIQDGRKLPQRNVKNINNLFRKGLLDDVELIDAVLSAK